jgi:biopolymer transport protein TolR
MAMTMGGGGGYSSDINVTPMIDVLLVLLIIFMVIVPVRPRAWMRWCPSRPRTPQQQPNDRTIVVQVLYPPPAVPPQHTRSTRPTWPKAICCPS